MDIYASLKKQQREGIEQYGALAEQYAKQGFDVESMAELLQLDGCDTDKSKLIARTAANKLPPGYFLDTVPISFEEVREIVSESIKSASLDRWKLYFGKYAGNKYANTLNRIIVARDKSLKLCVSEIEEEISPLVQDLLLTNKALSSEDKIAGSINDKEALEQELFGVWPVHLIQKRAEIDKADEKLFKHTEIRPGDNISFI